MNTSCLPLNTLTAGYAVKLIDILWASPSNTIKYSHYKSQNILSSVFLIMFLPRHPGVRWHNKLPII